MAEMGRADPQAVDLGQQQAAGLADRCRRIRVADPGHAVVGARRLDERGHGAAGSATVREPRPVRDRMALPKQPAPVAPPRTSNVRTAP